MAQLVIRTDSLEELHRAIGLANEVTNYSGGWVHPLGGPQAITLDVPYASNEELREIWQRVNEGEAPGAAYKAVRGPCYHFRERMRALVRPGRQSSTSLGMVEIKHRYTKEVLLCVDSTTLEGAYLAGTVLDGAMLARENLCEAELQGATIIGSELEGARLCHADLRGVAMMGANLAHADLERAAMWGAYCLEANLSGANLCGADLRGADLKGAYLFGTDLRGAVLSGVGLTYTRYDVHTRWPKDFNPRQHFATLVGWFLEEHSTNMANIDEAQAIEIAKRAVAANETWADSATYEATRDDDGWSVQVLDVMGYGADGEPLTTCGGDRLIKIEKDGRVVRYMFGY